MTAPDMNAGDLDRIAALRKALHEHAEVSCEEHESKKLLQSFLRENTSLVLHDCGSGFYAAHIEAGADKPSVALRADYDALAVPEGGAKHLCGHDGHAAALCGVALALEGRTIGRNVYLLFQPAEEIGAGAASCCALFEQERVDMIFGSHNLPGVPFGVITTRPGTFACASRGLILRMQGKATHAAYPENGVSPANAAGKLLCALPEIAAPERYTGMTLCTVIGMQMGEKAFGAAAADAEIWLTLRGEHDADLNALEKRVLECAKHLCHEDGLGFAWETQDAFPATENDAACAQKVLDICGGEALPEPMRWSEDFGHYLLRCKGAYFGIGAGEQYPALHTACYEYPDELLGPTIAAWLKLLAQA